MKIKYAFILLLLMSFVWASAQNKGQKKSAKEVLQELPDMLIAQPDKGPDTLADKLINFNMQLTVPPIWKEQGALIFSDFKLQKADKEPLSESFPLSEKKIAQGLQITMNTIKKSTTEKKEMVMKEVKNHLAGIYKDNGEPLSSKEVEEKASRLISSPENFTTDAGKTGELYYINDLQTQQSNFVMLLLIPGEDGKSCHFVFFEYYRYNYETTLPEDILEWKMFVYPDEQQAYVDFTKKILKTLVIK